MAFIHLITALVLSLTSLQQGEQLFLENKPREALPHLEKALYENPQEEKIYLYLGIVYERLCEFGKALESYEEALRHASQINFAQGMTHPMTNIGQLYLTLGDLANARRHVLQTHDAAAESQDRSKRGTPVCRLRRRH